MAKESVAAGTTSHSVNIFIQNSSVTTGAGLPALVYNSSGLTAYYTFAGANAGSVAVTLAPLAAVNSAYSSGGFKEIDATNMPGLYRLDVPNAALAASKGQTVTFCLQGATNMAETLLEIELTGWNNQDAVHGGLSCLPNAAITTNASLLTSGTGTDQISVASGKVDAGKINGVSTGSVTTVSANVGTTQPINFTGTGGSALIKSDVIDWNSAAVATPNVVGVPIVDLKYTLGTISPAASGSVAIDWGQISNKTATVALTNTTINGGGGGAPTAAQVASAVWQDATPGDFTVASSIGKSLYTSGVIPGGSGGLFIAGSNAATTVNVTGSITGSLSGSVGSVSGAVGSVTGNVGGNVTGSVGSVLAGGLIDLTTTTFAEPSSVPAATATLKDKIGWLAALGRNKINQTSGAQVLRNDADSATIGTAVVSDNGVTTVRGKFS